MSRFYKIFVFAVLSALISVCFGSVTADDSVLVFDASPEGLARREFIASLKMNADFMDEAAFEPTRQALMAGLNQPIPEVKTTHPLEKENWEGMDVYTLSAGEDYERIVFFIHGGAWVYEITEQHFTFCDALADQMNAKVYLPIYPLAPQHTYQETYDLLVPLYQSLLEQGKPIYIMGDSAGGNIVFGVLHQLKANNIQMPAKAVVLHPGVDLTFSNPAIAEAEKNDVTLGVYGCRECAKMWANGTDLADPVINPLYDDVSGYPDMLMICGSDILTPDDELMFAKLREAGNNAKMIKGNNLWHVFAVSEIPEKAMILEQIADFCK